MDARNWDRRIVDKEVACEIAGVPEEVFLYDLSMGGCMVETADGRDLRNAAIALQLHQYEITPGQVVWQVGGCLGVRFDAPIHDALVRHLGFMPPEVPFDEQPPRDRFGRVLPPLDAGERRR